MKKTTMKDIASHIPEHEFDEHLDLMQLTLFKEQKLTEDEENLVFEHLSQCKHCRDVLKFANELEEEEKKIEPVNNPDYKGMLKHFMPFAAAVVIFLGVPQGDKYFNTDASMKGVFTDKNIFEESMEFWGKVYDSIVKIKEDRL